MKKSIICLLILFISGFITGIYGQKITVTGVVTSTAEGMPLPGVNVVVSGTTQGTITDIDGKYTIEVPGPEAELQFSYIGFITQVIQVGNKTTINPSLEEETTTLDEIVVIGYGVQRKSDLTGAVASVQADEIQKVPVTAVESALQGRAAGVQVSQNTGSPGAAVKIRIRGISTITQVNSQNQGDPIWIVDGVPAPANTVNANDIESIEILKDASSSAIYGSNGANGVILITTKQGKAGKTEATLNYYRGIQTIPNKIELANGPQFGAMYTELEALNGETEFTFPDYNNLPTYDYQDMIFRNAIMDNIDFSVSGGSDKMTSYLGLGYVKQEGILESSDYQKFSFRLNSSYKANKWLTVGENLSFTQSNTVGFEEWQYMNEYESPIMTALIVHPYLPPYDETGNYVPSTIGNSDSPLPKIELLNKERHKYEGNGLFYITIQPIKGLSLESRISSTFGFGEDYQFYQTYSYGANPGQFNNIPSIYRTMRKDFSYNWQNLISYNMTILNDINVGIVAGYEVGQSRGMADHGTELRPASSNRP